MVVPGIVWIGRRKALKRIVIVSVQTVANVPVAWAVKLRAQILRWTWDFRTGFHSHTAGESGGNHHRFAATGHSFKLYHALIYIHLREAAAIYFNIKFCAAHGDDRARRANLKCRRSPGPFLNLRAHTAKQYLKIFPAIRFRLLKQEFGVWAH